ncbi:uncharacterized protein VTP21DRAFT_4027 [Calcarisporiella thermophila]|uniref:uncharacterized protein n=1 Tax=Calcarisporiella thermophila TaxID=911321 RepID=UPI003743222A
MTRFVCIYFVLLAISAVQAFDINTVDNVTKANFGQWCTLQTSTCEGICQDSGHSVQQNDCDPATLVYHCICNNNVAPNSSEYTETIPYFQCTYDQQACVGRCSSGDVACYNACRSTNCSATHPKKYNRTATQTTIGTGPRSTTSTNSIFNQGSDAVGLVANLGFAAAIAVFVGVMNRY